MKKILVAGIVLASAVSILSVNAQTGVSADQADSALANRKAVLRLFSYNMGPINGMARGQVEFDAALAERNARRIAFLAPMLVETFASADTRAFDLETEALPVIWENFGEFEVKAQALIDGANTFAEIAARGDQQETLMAIRAFGSNCGNCHDMFRVD